MGEWTCGSEESVGLGVHSSDSRRLWDRDAYLMK